ncbi:hypothetical protein CYMTET_13988 [Cymbomonas tetramitiformis]|uniref:Uncharacterized protein n=1 Tax=Cymbomonas tetramitiformis TaxID=36881 RepID=A0AAE0LAU4_9CHLO|nr:hypothetical protein CYMTET_13988 [Cymbomonas tetramitiformis]
MHTLALCQFFQVAAGDGAEAFTAAVAEYGAPAGLAGGESDDIDVSAYGFTVSERLRQRSLLGDDGVDARHAPVSALSAVAMADDAPQQAVPHVSGASAGGVPAGDYHYGVPTEEFPGGDDSCRESFVEAPGCASAVRRQQVVGCGAPPFDMRPHFIVLACFIGLLAFGIAAGAQGSIGSGMAAEASVYGGVATTGEPYLLIITGSMNNDPVVTRLEPKLSIEDKLLPFLEKVLRHLNTRSAGRPKKLAFVDNRNPLLIECDDL